MGSFLDFLNPSANPGGLLGNLAPAAGAGASSADAGGGSFASGAGNFLSSYPLMLMALGSGIAQGGIGRGLQMAVPAAQAEQAQLKAQQAQGATYQALLGSGVPQGQALAAALNPGALKAIARSRFDARPTFTTIGRDAQGLPSYGFVDASSKSVTPYRPPAASAPPSKDAASLDAFIGRLGTLMETEGKGAAEGKAPATNAAMAAAQDAVAAGEGASAAGKEGDAQSAAGGETAKAVRSAGMGDAEIGAWKETLSAAGSPAQRKAAIGRGVDLINARLAVMAEQYQRATGRPAPQWLSPRAKATLTRLREWTKPEGKDGEGQ
jgi:hypothetical protein